MTFFENLKYLTSLDIQYYNLSIFAVFVDVFDNKMNNRSNYRDGISFMDILLTKYVRTYSMYAEEKLSDTKIHRNKKSI